MSCEHRLDDCGCCEAVRSRTPAAIGSTPGRTGIRRRVGTSSQFAESMLAGLTDDARLERFTSRRSDDPAIALVDAWSLVLDVLAFYTERVADECYLRTAAEERSLAELAHSVGYAPGRGRASTTSLAFTLEEGPGSPTSIPIPTGTQVASLPGPEEQPQTYETTSPLVARPAWNAMRAEQRVAREPATGDTGAYLEGVRTDLQVGDAILLVGAEREDSDTSEAWAFRRLSSVTPLAAQDLTLVRWVDPLGRPAPHSGRADTEQVPAARDAAIYVLRRKAAIFGAAAPDYRLIDESVGGGRKSAAAGATSMIQVKERSATGSERRAVVERSGSTVSADWPGFKVEVQAGYVDLDATYPTAVPDGWAALTRTGKTLCYRIKGTTEESRTDFTLNAKVTRLELAGPSVSAHFDDRVRDTSAWVGSEPLPLAPAPVTTPVQGSQVRLADDVPTLEAGRTVVVRGPRPVVRVAEGVRDLELSATGRATTSLHPGDTLEVVGPVTENAGVDRAAGTVTWVTTRGTVTAPAGALRRVAPDDDARVYSETAVIAGPTPDTAQVSTLRFTAALSGCYDRVAARILGNVAPASHGETTTQVLGSGDAAEPFQRFTLTQQPLTYVASGEGKVAPTLAVRVDGRLWKEVPRLYGTRADAEVYTTRTEGDGKVSVLFGDGRTGSRLPTGTNNVTATYRVGTGVAGRVAADQLTLPMTRPLGLRSVTNPLPAGLGADPEPPGQVRENAPRSALTLDRVVSLQDVEDFARSEPGIAKAGATWLWDGGRRFVHLTVAGTQGQSVDGDARDALARTIQSHGSRLPLLVSAAQVTSLHVSVSVVVDPDHEPDTVLAAVEEALTDALDVDARALGQPLTRNDVVRAAHEVPGVVAITVTEPVADVPAPSARVSGGTVEAAHLVALAAGGLTVTGVSS
jgi:hypothetical protein